MSVMLNEEQASQILRDGKKEAQAVLQDVNQTLAVLKEVEKQISDQSEGMQEVPTLVSMIKDYVEHTYTDLQEDAAAYIMSGLMYLSYPVDYVPDVLPEVGYKDDALVISVVTHWFEDEINAYKKQSA